MLDHDKCHTPLASQDDVGGNPGPVVRDVYKEAARPGIYALDNRVYSLHVPWPTVEAVSDFPTQHSPESPESADRRIIWQQSTSVSVNIPEYHHAITCRESHRRKKNIQTVISATSR